MWQHRLAVRRADLSLSAFEAYLVRSKELAATTRAAMKLIQELELVEAGFAFLRAPNPTSGGGIVGESVGAGGRQWTEQVDLL